MKTSNATAQLRNLLVQLLKNCPEVQGVSFVKQSDELGDYRHTIHNIGPLAVYVSWRHTPFPAQLLKVDDVINSFAVGYDKQVRPSKRIFLGV